MTKFYSHWHMNPTLIPTNPEERTKLWLGMLQRVKADMKSGDILDWGITADLSAGYTLRETDEKGLIADASNWMPYIIMDAKPVLTPDQALEAMKRSGPGVKK